MWIPFLKRVVFTVKHHHMIIRRTSNTLWFFIPDITWTQTEYIKEDAVYCWYYLMYSHCRMRYNPHTSRRCIFPRSQVHTATAKTKTKTDVAGYPPGYTYTQHYAAGLYSFRLSVIHELWWTTCIGKRLPDTPLRGAITDLYKHLSWFLKLLISFKTHKKTS